MSKIEQIIAELEDYIDNCKLQPLSNSKIIVNRNEIEDLIDELKENIPDEIKKYQRIIANRDAILKDAQDKAEEMIKKANEMTAQLVSEHEIMQQAYKEANAVVDDANAQADEIMKNAIAESTAMRNATNQYLDDSLADIQNILNTSIEGLNVKYDALSRSLESSLEVVTQNRKSFHEMQAEQESRAETREAAEEYLNEVADEDEVEIDMNEDMI